MKSSLRMALLACASFVGLALAAPALAAYQPSLTIEQSSYKVGAPATADVFLAVPKDDDATAKLTIFSPAGYTANLTAAPGTKIGKVIAVVKANALAGALLTLAGDVVVANPADPAIVTAASQCTPGVTNDTVWVLNASLQGQTINIPVFVRKVGPYVTQTVCFSPPADRGVRRPARARRLHGEGRLHERGQERRLRVGGHLHALPRDRARRIRPAPSSGAPGSACRSR